MISVFQLVIFGGMNDQKDFNDVCILQTRAALKHLPAEMTGMVVHTSCAFTFMPCITYYIKHKRLCLTKFPNTEKRVQNATCSGIFLTILEVFGNVVKHCLKCLIGTKTEK